jgi:hypothetical protein
LYEKGKGRNFFRNIGRIRIRRNWIREIRDSNLLSIEILLKHTNEIKQLKMNPK